MNNHFFDECARIQGLQREAEAARVRLQNQNADAEWHVCLHMHYEDGHPRVTMWRREDISAVAAMFLLAAKGPRLLTAGAYWKQMQEMETVLRRWTGLPEVAAVAADMTENTKEE